MFVLDEPEKRPVREGPVFRLYRVSDYFAALCDTRKALPTWSVVTPFLV